MSSTWKALCLACLLSGASPLAWGQDPQDDPYTLYSTGSRSQYWNYLGNVGGYLQGVAAVTAANAQYRVLVQEARARREEVVSVQLDNRRKKIEQWIWERSLIPTPEDIRDQERARAQRRSLDPPSTEIWSGASLNVLLGELQKLQREVGTEFSEPLSPELLAQINVTSGAGGHLGLLRQGKLHWPLLFYRPEMSDARERMDRLLGQAVEEARQGTVEPATLLQILELREEMARQLTQLTRSRRDHSAWTPTLCIDAERYLEGLKETFQMLKRPDAGAYLTGRYLARGKNVAELVRHMTDQGLRFAPATVGAENAYTTLHHHLVSHDRTLRALLPAGSPLGEDARLQLPRGLGQNPP